MSEGIHFTDDNVANVEHEEKPDDQIESLDDESDDDDDDDDDDEVEVDEDSPA